MKRKAKKRAGRPALGRVKFTTTLPPETVVDMGILAVEGGYGSSAQLIVQLVKAEMKRRSDNQTAKL